MAQRFEFGEQCLADRTESHWLGGPEVGRIHAARRMVGGKPGRCLMQRAHREAFLQIRRGLLPERIGERTIANPGPATAGPRRRPLDRVLLGIGQREEGAAGGTSGSEQSRCDAMPGPSKKTDLTAPPIKSPRREGATAFFAATETAQ